MEFEIEITKYGNSNLCLVELIQDNGGFDFNYICLLEDVTLERAEKFSDDLARMLRTQGNGVVVKSY